MGTYNYRPTPYITHVDSLEHLSHDVDPWYKWNNVPNEPARGENRKTYASSPEIKKYRDSYKFLMK